MTKIAIHTCTRFFLLLLPLLVYGQTSNNATVMNTTSTTNTTTSPTPTQSPSPSSYPSDQFTFTRRAFIPPWGESSFGGMGKSDYRHAGLLDIRRNGWSWTPASLSKSAPFCYDTNPRPFDAPELFKEVVTYESTCYTGQVVYMCEALGGTSAYSDLFCIEDPKKPFVVVGPVCWNQTCYNEETVSACAELGGQFVGGHISAANSDRNDVYSKFRSDAAWCAVPGKHTVFGPACYGQECFTDDLANACTALNGTNFADIFCLLDDSYTIIGPICKPTENNTEDASVCYPEETETWCQSIGGTSVGSIFCIVRDTFSVLGPFCHVTFYNDEENNTETVSPQCSDASSLCTSLNGTPLADGTFCILPDDDYMVAGPFCVGFGCAVFDFDLNSDFDYEGTLCEDLGGVPLGQSSCLLKGDFAVIGPLSYTEGAIYYSGYELSDNVDESMVHNLNGQYLILNATFSVYGPTCYGSHCYVGNDDCSAAGGSNFGNIFCAVLDDDTPAPTATPKQASTKTSAGTYPFGKPAMGLLVVMFASSVNALFDIL